MADSTFKFFVGNSYDEAANEGVFTGAVKAIVTPTRLSGSNYFADATPLDSGVVVEKLVKNLQITGSSLTLSITVPENVTLVSVRIADIKTDGSAPSFVNGSVIDNSCDISYSSYTVYSGFNASTTKYKFIEIVTEGGEPAEVNSVNNNYLVDKEQFQKFQTDVYDVVSVESVGGVPPLTDFISSTRIYPFKIDVSNVAKDEQIKLRDRVFDSAPLLASDVVESLIGTFTIPAEYNNVLDFKDVEVSLFLPFYSGDIALEPQLVIGKSFLVKMFFNVSDGSATIVIEDDLGVVFEIDNMVLGSDYPFFSKYYEGEKTDFRPAQALNKIDTSYILVKKPIYSGGIELVERTGDLLTVKGLVKVEENRLNSSGMTSDEFNKVVDILANGVYIK